MLFGKRVGGPSPADPGNGRTRSVCMRAVGNPPAARRSRVPPKESGKWWVGQKKKKAAAETLRRSCAALACGACGVLESSRGRRRASGRLVVDASRMRLLWICGKESQLLRMHLDEISTVVISHCPPLLFYSTVTHSVMCSPYLVVSPSVSQAACDPAPPPVAE